MTGLILNTISLWIKIRKCGKLTVRVMQVKRLNVKKEWYLPGIVKGMAFTLKKFFLNLFFKKQRITLNYPEEHYQYGPRFKGNHILTVKKDGSIRCTACMLCATNCPAHCIKITASESDDPSVEKYPISYENRYASVCFLWLL